MHPSRPDDPDDPVLTTREAARLLGIAVSTAQLWIENGLLPAWKTPGGHRRVRLSEVGRLLRERGATDVAAGAREFAAPASSTLPQHDPARLAALESSGLVDSRSEAMFDRLAWLATQASGCPIAVLSLVTARHVWFKSRVGLALAQSPLDGAFCTHTIAQDGPLVVMDAHLDRRFRDSALVTVEQVRFYAGFPLAGRDGHRFGALCVMDREPRLLRERELRALGDLAAMASDDIRRR